ncbi:MAG: saccharopine dehydrogenase family protein [Solirubrobacterales bacterium]
MSAGEIDVVVFGATGVTGRQVAVYLAERAPEAEMRWAPAARDAAKLDRSLSEDGVEADEFLTADLADPASLAAMARRAKVVLDLVGPYTLYGRPVIEACIENGAHYVDLTGEIPFVRTIARELGGAAERAGVKIVQVCGFEALPPDLMALSAAEAARERWDEPLLSAELEVHTTPPPGLPRPSDVLSGGTIQSMAVVTGAEGAAAVTDPAALVEDPATAEQVRARSPIELAPRRGLHGAVVAPMSPAAFINPAVIHRTAELAASASGRAAQPFRYREGLALPGSTPTLPLRYAAAGALSGMQAGMRLVARSRPAIRRRAADAMSALMPSSGFGPSGERLREWSWGMELAARTTGGHAVTVTLDADGHPGYLSTARMIGETGLLLAEPGATPEGAGSLTPAIALGTGSLPRFERAGMRFSVSA